jgi:radical SAM superfamily enzyme
VKIIEILPPDMVIHRLTGDSPRQLLIGPTWSLNKRAVLNAIDQELLIQNSWQGKFYP